MRSTLSARLIVFSAALSLVSLTGCKDEWDEHYDAEASGLTYNGDMMGYISENSQLADFVEVVKAAGFDTDLASSQIRTLWAPVNGTFNKDSLISLAKAGGKKSVITGFIKNHLARYAMSYNTPDSLSLDEPKSVLLLNSKILVMDPKGTFGTANVTKPNITCANGVVHVIDKAQPYQTNLYEQIEAAHFAWLAQHPEEAGNDSLVSMYTFLQKYNDDSLDVNKSVYRGVDENGNRIYVDSVVIRNNTVLNGMDALIYTEDSNYFAIIPSVEAYQERVRIAKELLVYNPSENATDPKMCDSLQNYNANVFAITDLFFNVNTNSRSGVLVTDSAVSTTYKRSNWENHVYYAPYAEGGILSGKNKVSCSNGTAFMAKEYPMSVRDQFYKKIDVPCNKTTNIDQTTDDDGKLLYTKNVNPDYQVWTYTVNTRDSSYTFSFLDVQATTMALNPTIAFKIPNTLKATYDMYLVYAPIWVLQYNDFEAALKGHETLVGTNQDPLRPYYFKVTVFERNNTDPNIGMYPKSGVAIKNPADGSSTFTTNVENFVDTLFLGTIETKNAYYNTTSEGLLVQLAANISSKNVVNYSREMYLSKIILKPHEEETSDYIKFRKR
ncbi:MAG: fasciclin domain-containing protein [Bacteroidaceae bacterium]|nr:fasciclin domain-containing protein [Bacteroidaceae bacterium]